MIEFCRLEPPGGEEWLWERFARVGGEDADAVDVFWGSPGLYKRLVEVFEERIRGTEGQARVREGLRRVRVLQCGGAMSYQGTLDWWAELAGRPLAQLYGSTETGMVCGTGVGGVGERFAAVGISFFFITFVPPVSYAPIQEQSKTACVAGPD